MARPKLDAAMVQKICDHVRAGNYLEVAATAVGVHRTTVHRWMRLGRAQERGHFRRFLVAVEKAQAESESRDMALIAKAALTDWKAAAWRLERKSPRRWGARVAISVQEELDSMFDRLKVGVEPAVYERILDVLSLEDAPALPQLPRADPDGVE